MDFGLSEEQVALQNSVNRYLDEQAGLEQLKGFAKGADSTQLWEGLAELGVTSLLFDDETGGLGLKILDAALVAECLGAHATPAPFIGSAVLAPLAAARSDNPSAFDINGLLSGESLPRPAQLMCGLEPPQIVSVPQSAQCRTSGSCTRASGLGWWAWVGLLSGSSASMAPASALVACAASQLVLCINERGGTHAPVVPLSLAACVRVLP